MATDDEQEGSARSATIFRRASFKVIVKKIERPFSNKIDDELNWLCECLGFFEPIDKDKTASAVFKEIIVNAEKGKLLTSTELAERVEMSRGAVINHLNRLIRSGLVEKQGHYYLPRSKSVTRTIQEIEEDIDSIFRRMELAAKAIDKKFGIRIRE